MGSARAHVGRCHTHSWQVSALSGSQTDAHALREESARAHQHRCPPTPPLTHPPAHTKQTHNENRNKQEQQQEKRRERKLLRTCRAALDAFRLHGDR